MGRLVAILISALVFSQCLFAQDMTEQQIKDEVYKVVTGIQSIQCDFTQTKTVKMLADKSVSTGRMAYQHDKKLRWEYITPFEHRFILNETNVLILDKDKKEVVDVEKSRIFKEVSKLIKGDVVGQSFKDGKTFDVACSVVGNEYVAVLTTKKSQLKKMFSGLTLHIDKNRSVLTQIELVGAKGDKTVLSFQNIEVNKPIDDALFTIN